jgi:hypothetical protein
VFRQSQSRALANRILTYWYSGIDAETNQYGLVTGRRCTRSTTGDCVDGRVVAQTTVTYISALAWTTNTFAKAPTECGGPLGFWATKPV